MSTAAPLGGWASRVLLGMLAVSRPAGLARLPLARFYFTVVHARGTVAVHGALPLPPQDTLAFLPAKVEALL